MIELCVRVRGFVPVYLFPVFMHEYVFVDYLVVVLAVQCYCVTLLLTPSCVG